MRYFCTKAAFKLALYRHSLNVELFTSSSIFLVLYLWSLHVHVFKDSSLLLPGHVGQSVTCLATDVSLTADLGVASSIPARSHTFVEIGH